jgi:putative hydrolase of HD superfamily
MIVQGDQPGSRGDQAGSAVRLPRMAGATTQDRRAITQDRPYGRREAMESKAGNPIELLERRETHPLVQAYFELCHLKQLYRQGWLRRGVPPVQCESVAEHSFGVATLALWLAKAYFPDLDECKVLRMALLHDIGEIYTGDIIPGDEMAAEEKHKLEARSVQTVFGRRPDGDAYLRLWEEFEQGSTAEARFVRQIDRLEMALQAGVYAAQGFPGLDEFFDTARGELDDPELVTLFEAIPRQP